MSEVAINLAEIRGRIEQAARRCGRDPKSINLVGVSKRQCDNKLVDAFQAGLRDFGENTVQELVRKQKLFRDRGFEARWHFIGHLQRNKVNTLLRWTPYRLHSLDRINLAEALDSRLEDTPLNVLIEVNLGGEVGKSGVNVSDFPDLLDRLNNISKLRIRGLMAIPPAKSGRRFFDKLRHLLDSHADHPALRHADELSMGMSDDFEAAIEAGATSVRIGTGIFGLRRESG